jgi:O-antigen/teichoic acid export membrane protein
MFHQIKRLMRHSGIYGIGLVVSSILGVLLLPLYTRYLTRADYGVLETLVAGTTVVALILRLGVASGFFRFYFDSSEPERRMAVVRTSFWFTMVGATSGLLAGLVLAEPISRVLFESSDRASLVRAAAVGLWVQMNYEQLASLLRVEERSVQFVIATIANIVVSVGATVLLVVAFEQGPLGVLVGNLTGTLVVYVILLASRRDQVGRGFDRELLRQMQRFGIPLLASGLALWAINLIDRFFLIKLAGEAETGLYSMGVRISSVVVIFFLAFRTAWPAFAYSIEDDREARQTFGYVLTYLLYLGCWLSLALGLLSPWIVRVLAPSNPEFWPASRPVALLSFGACAFAAYIVMAIGLSRAKRTQFNWVVSGSAALLNIGLNVALIPPYGMMGAAVATFVAYLAMFLGMTFYAQRIYPVDYQWRRVVSIVSVSAALVIAGKLTDASLPVAIALTAAFPFLLASLGFYLPDERALLRRVVLGRRSGHV